MARETLRLTPQPAPAAEPARPAAPAAAPAAASRASGQVGRILGVPLTGLHVRRLELLERLVGPGRYRGWGRQGAAADYTAKTPSTWELYFVDLQVGEELLRYTGETLHLAIGEATRAARRFCL